MILTGQFSFSYIFWKFVEFVLLQQNTIEVIHHKKQVVQSNVVFLLFVYVSYPYHNPYSNLSNRYVNMSRSYIVQYLWMLLKRCWKSLKSNKEDFLSVWSLFICSLPEYSQKINEINFILDKKGILYPYIMREWKFMGNILHTTQKKSEKRI